MKAGLVLLSFILSVGGALGQAPASPILDRKLAPRSLYPSADVSARGLYVITFPPPNECLERKPIEASSRTVALYIFVAEGGFTLNKSKAGFTVWTIEEWEAWQKEAPPEFVADMKKRCHKETK